MLGNPFTASQWKCWDVGLPLLLLQVTFGLGTPDASQLRETRAPDNTDMSYGWRSHVGDTETHNVHSLKEQHGGRTRKRRLNPWFSSNFSFAFIYLLLFASQIFYAKKTFKKQNADGKFKKNTVTDIEHPLANVFVSQIAKSPPSDVRCGWKEQSFPLEEFVGIWTFSSHWHFKGFL